jgi:DNA-binding transcriptional MerR regulator
MFYSLRQLQKEGIAPSDTSVRRYIKEGRISPPYQMAPGGMRRFDEDHRDQFLGLKKPKPVTA